VGNAIVAMSAIDLLCIGKTKSAATRAGRCAVRSLHANSLFGADCRPATKQAHEKSTATFILRVCKQQVNQRLIAL
jgi:hypothetical protein